jgi:HK97 family phage portal protein
MTTLETLDGRLLQAQRPAGAVYGSPGGFLPSVFPPMWSDGERLGPHSHLRNFETIYRSQPVVAAVVDKLARRIASLPFDNYRLSPDGAREIVEGDSLDTLIDRPMPRCGSSHLLAHIAQSLLIHGNAVVAKVRTSPDLPPDMLWPLDWARLNAYGQLGGTIEWWSTSQFEYQERYIAAEDTIHFAWPSPCGGEIGVSPLEKLGVTVKLDDAVQRHQQAMFDNGVRPSLAVALKSDNVKKEQLDFARERVEAMHRGASNSGRTFFMGANVEVQPLSLNPVEVALIDQRKLNREEVGMVYDLAGPLMNDLEHGTYSNVEELLRSLYRDVIPPWTTLIEQTFNTQLLAVEPAWIDQFLAFDFTEKLKGDPVELATSLKLQVEAGLITRNEARRILNMPPVTDIEADRLTYNANNQAPIDFHRNTEVLVNAASGKEVNPPAAALNSPPPGVNGR